MVNGFNVVADQCTLEPTDWIPVLCTGSESEYRDVLLGWTINTFYTHINSYHCLWFQVCSLTCCLCAAWLGRGTNWDWEKSWVGAEMGSLLALAYNIILNNATGCAPGHYQANRALRQGALYMPTFIMLRIMKKPALDTCLFLLLLFKQIPHYPNMICLPKAKWKVSTLFSIH